MSIKAIRTLLQDRAATIVGLPTQQRENTHNVAVTNQPFTRTTLLPAESRNASIGTTGSVRRGGLFQLDLFYPSNAGTDSADDMADAALAAFSRGTILTDGTTTVTIELAWAEQGSIIETFYMIPIVIRWRSFT